MIDHSSSLNIIIQIEILTTTKAAVAMASHVTRSSTTHYNDVIMSTMASQITSLTIVYSTIHSRHRSKKTSKLRVTGLCEGNSPVTGEFRTQRASNTESVSIWWCHHAWCWLCRIIWPKSTTYINYPGNLSARKWYKIQTYFYLS